MRPASRECLDPRTSTRPRPRRSSRPSAGARAGFDARVRAQANAPDVPVAHLDPTRPVRARSTILAQAIHHATEHRAQIAGALSTNGNGAIDLDAIDMWEYGDAEGLGA